MVTFEPPRQVTTPPLVLGVRPLIPKFHTLVHTFKNEMSDTQNGGCRHLAWWFIWDQI